MAENYTTEYQGGFSTFKSNYGDIFTGYTTSAGSMGMTTDPRSANVLQEASGKLAMGVKHIEIAQVSPEVFESIPVGYLKEVNRLAKLTGTEMTLHAPVMEASGIGQHGFDELQRQAVERTMNLAIERAHELNPDGSAPVTFHSSAQAPGSQWKTLGEEGKPREAIKMIAINRESGQMMPLEEEKMYYPDLVRQKELTEEQRKKAQRGELAPEQIYEKKNLSEGVLYGTRKKLINANATQWDNSISEIILHKERADEILQTNAREIQQILPLIRSGEFDPSKDLTPTQLQAWNSLKNAETYLEDTQQKANAIFHKAYKYGNEAQQKRLKEIAEDYTKKLSQVNRDPVGQAPIIQGLLHELKETHGLAPEIFVSVEQFTNDKSSETFANVAVNSFKKFGSKAPIISIENPPAGGALSTGEDLKNLVEATRKKFVDKLMEDKKLNLSEKEAQREAEKLIGVTWDVGHINMLRKQGFGKEELVRETEKVAKFVKHVHLSDNFGLEHTELPMGMGNVPLKEMMAKLDKEGYEGKKIVEAAHWWQHFKSPPFIESMQAMGSQMYTGAGPTWNQNLGLQQGYSSGYGAFLPDINYQTFGAGFSQLPMELGGQRQGAQGSRMSGRGME